MHTKRSRRCSRTDELITEARTSHGQLTGEVVLDAVQEGTLLLFIRENEFEKSEFTVVILSFRRWRMKDSFIQSFLGHAMHSPSMVSRACNSNAFWATR